MPHPQQLKRHQRRRLVARQIDPRWPNRPHIWPHREAERRDLMKKLMRRDERGITTAEYAVGTACGAGLAGVLYQLLTSGFGQKLLELIFNWVMKTLGIG
jgi:hypothetical protein